MGGFRVWRKFKIMHIHVYELMVPPNAARM
jgi:hypothetical protein